MNIIKYAATAITAIRITGSGCLLFIEPLSAPFYVIYTICGVSDVVDGYVARKTNTASKTGAVVDGVADFIFVAVILFILVPIVSWSIWVIWWIAAIALIRFISLAIGFVKYRAIAFLHTYANKATGFALFCFPVLYHAFGLPITAIALCSAASLSALEELTINIKERDLNRNNKGIFDCVK